MSKLIFKLVAFSFGIGLLLTTPTHLLADPDTGAYPCSSQLLLAIFPQQLMQETLQKFDVPEDKWYLIITDLAHQDKYILRTVENTASKMTPNPMKTASPEDLERLITIFREAVSDTFTEVLNSNGIVDNNQIQAMLKYLQEAKAKNYGKCIANQKALLSAPHEFIPLSPASRQPENQDDLDNINSVQESRSTPVEQSDSHESPSTSHENPIDINDHLSPSHPASKPEASSSSSPEKLSFAEYWHDDE